jgi:hypothetical protein
MIKELSRVSVGTRGSPYSRNIEVVNNQLFPMFE